MTYEFTGRSHRHVPVSRLSARSQRIVGHNILRQLPFELRREIRLRARRPVVAARIIHRNRQRRAQHHAVMAQVRRPRPPLRPVITRRRNVRRNTRANFYGYRN